MKVKAYILPIIVIAQFFCTSVWFAGNAVLSDMTMSLGLSPNLLAQFTMLVQLGFIVGTFVFAALTIADRFSPVKVFLVSALAAAMFNYGLTLSGVSTPVLLSFRFMTGFCLAGIYPVGMKIASDYYQVGLGKSLGFLVGALVLGTAFPHLLKTLNQGFDWQNVIYATSALSSTGGIMMWVFVADGPFRKQASVFKFTAFTSVFRNKEFRKAAFGYFGHMWELYAFWAFVPLILKVYQNTHAGVSLNISLYSFIIIAIGSLACIISGLICEHFGVEKVAFRSLLLSMGCCLASPFFIIQSSPVLFITFLIFWGMVVIADSPLFSTLVARYAPVENRGVALTIVNCLGFSITILSIQLLSIFTEVLKPQYAFMILAIGPIIGLAFSIKKVAVSEEIA